MLLYAGVYFCHFVREKLQPWGHWSCTELPKTLTCKLSSLEREGNFISVRKSGGKKQIKKNKPVFFLYLARELGRARTQGGVGGTCSLVRILPPQHTAGWSCK